VDVVNGGAGLRLGASPIRSTTGWRPGARPLALGRFSSPMTGLRPSIRTSSALKSATRRDEPSIVGTRPSRTPGSRARGRRQANRDRLDNPADRPDRDLPADERTQRVADHPVDDPAGLLGVDEVWSIAGDWRTLADRRLGRSR
jgi:hypothetical protein